MTTDVRFHQYAVGVEWTGNTGQGTAGYRSYERAFRVHADGKPDIPGSSDPGFRGDPSRWNPEDLLVAAVSACHKLWYLHLCSTAGLVVTGYSDRATGVMAEQADGGGQFCRVVLRPHVVFAAGADLDLAFSLHHAAHEKCFIANSVNFPVEVEPELTVAPPPA